MTDAAYVRSVEEQRAEQQERLHGPTGYLAAVARHEIAIGTRLRFGPRDADVVLAGMPRTVEIEARDGGFIVDGAFTGPTSIRAGRYTLRLSHQHAPAVVVLDAESPRRHEDAELRWFPVDPAMRIRTELLPDSEALDIASTASAPRPAERAGWVTFTIDGVGCRLAATRLLEPGVTAEHLDVYFRDATTGNESYEVGRYVTLEREGSGVILDFNLAYNPACALSPFYNCPIPPRENHLSIPIRAGEMAPRTSAPKPRR